MSKRGRKIILFSWRDIKNPLSGGAEILDHELAKRLVKEGHQFTVFSTAFKNSQKKEVVDGVKIIRKGRWYTYHIIAFFYYLFVFRGKFDRYIESWHGIPLFFSLYVPRKKRIMWICEVAGNIYFEMFSFPLNYIGYYLEKFALLFYKNTRIITISPSTRKDLISNNIPKKNIRIVMPGIDMTPVSEIISKDGNSLVFAGRVCRMKQVHHLVDIVRKVKDSISDVHLYITGKQDEDYLEEMKKKIIKYGLEDDVTFTGFISDDERNELFKKAKIMVSASVKEGFGMIVCEAAAFSTPSVTYDVEGYRDLITDDTNGLLADSGDKNDFADKVVKLLTDKELYKKMQQGAIKFAGEMSWERSYKNYKKYLRV